MKKTALVGVAALSIGILIGSQIPRGLQTGPISITTFKLKVPFKEWADNFDSKEASKKHREYKIYPIFRGISTEKPRQVIVIHKSKPGVVKSFLIENQKMIESTGHIIRTTRTSDWKPE